MKLAITWAYNYYHPSSCVVIPSWFHSKGLASDAIRSKPHPVAKAIYLKKLRSSQLLSSEGTGGAHVHLCYQRSNKRPKPRRSLIIQPDNLNTTGRYRHDQLLVWTQHPSKSIKHMKHHTTVPGPMFSLHHFVEKLQTKPSSPKWLRKISWKLSPLWSPEPLHIGAVRCKWQ